jgi:cytochrome c
MKRLLAVVMTVGVAGAGAAGAQVDEAAAQALLKKNECFKCHSVDKKKDGPPFKEVAASYREKPDAEALIHSHLISNPMIEVDGLEEEHRAIEGAEESAIRNAVRWILSRS